MFSAGLDTHFHPLPTGHTTDDNSPFTHAHKNEPFPQSFDPQSHEQPRPRASITLSEPHAPTFPPRDPAPRLLSLPPEVILLILTHLFADASLTITPIPIPTPPNATTTTTLSPRLTISSNPPLEPLLLTCHTLNHLTQSLLTSRKGLVRSVIWDFDTQSHHGRSTTAVSSRAAGTAGEPFADLTGLAAIKARLPQTLLRGVREVEVCVPPAKNLCGGCLCRWMGRLLKVDEQAGESKPPKLLEQVLLRVGARKVGVGEWVRMAEGTGMGRREVLEEILGPWGALRMLGSGVAGGSGSSKKQPSVLVEVPLMCDVRMACRHGQKCGRDCFLENFLYCVIDVGSMKMVEFKTQRCARTVAAQGLHKDHTTYMAAKQAARTRLDLEGNIWRVVQA